MSRWDEYDRMIERIEEGRRRIAEYNESYHAQIAPSTPSTALTPEEIEQWRKAKDDVAQLIRHGTILSEEWKLLNSGWVEFTSGQLQRRSFYVKNEPGCEDMRLPLSDIAALSHNKDQFGPCVKTRS